MTTGKVVGDDIKREYIQLIEHMKTQDLSGTFFGFRHLIGTGFGNSNSKLLICGRSVDGWRKGFKTDELKNDSVDTIINKIFHIPKKDLELDNQMNWIIRNKKDWDTRD